MFSFYPNDLFENDLLSDSAKAYVVFTAYKLDWNIKAAQSWDDIKETMTVMGSFALPMPNGGLMDSLTNDYTSANSIGGNVANKVGDMLNSGASAITAGVVDNALQRLGTVPDPKLTQLYRGTNQRLWSAVWQLVPQSQSESLQIETILKQIKMYGSPSRTDVVKDKVGVLHQPYVFGITFSNTIIDKMMKFDKMALTSYSINYFAQGYPSTFYDMRPKEIELTLNFSEYGVKVQQDWEDI